MHAQPDTGGDNTNRLVERLVERPVERPGERPGKGARAIVVGLDTSRAAQHALEWAAIYARQVNAPLRAVYVDPPITSLSDWSGAGWVSPVDLRALIEEERQAVQTVYLTIHPEPDWTLDHHVEGRPGPVLIEQSHGAALLVMGTHEHQGLGRLITGSVSHYCLSHATCPVLAIPPAPNDPPAPTAGHLARA